jgi:hypothetical protein
MKLKINSGMLLLYDDQNQLVDTFIPDTSPRVDNWLVNLPNGYTLGYNSIYHADIVPDKLIATGINGITVYTELGIKILSEHI